MSTQVLQVIPVPQIPFCKPCTDRGKKQVRAVREVGGEWWCSACFGKTDEIGEPTFRLIPETAVPQPKAKGIVYQTLKALQKAPAGIAAEIQLNGTTKLRMQSHLHEYATRWGMNITVTSAKGCLYVRRTE